MSRLRLLFLDAYDSFSNNIIALLQSSLNASITVLKIDDKRFLTTDDSIFHEYLRHFDGVIAGPGPGDPRNAYDVGLIARLWTLPDDCLLPVLGVCLGFQSLVLAFGGSVERLTEPRHGLVTRVTHGGESLFRDLGDVQATQYHSLHATLEPNSVQFKPLAWDLSSVENGPILMAAEHAIKPFCGVQYHPESICTNGEGGRIILNWWSEAQAWRSSHGKAGAARSPTLMFDNDDSTANSRSSMDLISPDAGCSSASSISAPEEPTRHEPLHTLAKVSWKCIDISASKLDTADWMELLRNMNDQVMLLESGVRDGRPVRAETGRFSVFGCYEQDAPRIRYWTANRLMETTLSGKLERVHASMADVWSNVQSFMDARQAVDGAEQIPFWGGLVGYISYEAGLETIDVAPAPVSMEHADLWFVFVERSLVIDHVERRMYVQSLREDDAWMQEVEKVITEQSLPGTHAARTHAGEKTTLSEPVMTAPSHDDYCDKVRLCQSHIRAGSSYELCLTDQSLVRFPTASPPSPWSLYRRLRSLNPAPFGAYLTLSDDHGAAIDILSSSPERFLSWSRGGQCQFRPIKGTVQKSGSMTRQRAEALLSSDKERAENLMIVDLIRHDLHGVVGAGNVEVKKLMAVEEYETVFQLVSVIEGRLPCNGSKKGIGVLAASLPPGSMTGAPKKRSCELLNEIERNRSRGVYSGVLGYIDVGGGGDFSVVIRTASRWADEGFWRVGAGGAVTVLSTPDGEYEEMMAKRSATSRLF